MRQKSRIASSTRPKDPPWGGRFSLWRIFRRKKRLLASGAWLYCRIKPGGCQGRGGHKSPGAPAISHAAGVFHRAKPHFSRPTERISLQKAKPGGLVFCVHFLSPATANAPATEQTKTGSFSLQRGPYSWRRERSSAPLGLWWRDTGTRCAGGCS